MKQDAFNEIKRIMARSTLLAYPYFTEEFIIHTNATDLQVGEVTSHKG